MYKNQGKTDLAEKHYLKALEIKKKALGEDHIELSTYYANLGDVYRDKRLTDLAIEYYLKSVEIHKKASLEDADPELAKQLNELGVMYYDRRELNKAEGYYLEAIEINKKVFPKENSGLVVYLSNLGLLYEL
jgi:tetratricopeptide (TPR) repeat protein